MQTILFDLKERPGGTTLLWVVITHETGHVGVVRHLTTDWGALQRQLREVGGALVVAINNDPDLIDLLASVFGPNIITATSLSPEVMKQVMEWQVDSVKDARDRLKAVAETLVSTEAFDMLDLYAKTML